METPREFAPGVAEAFAAQGVDISGIAAADPETLQAPAIAPILKHDVRYLVGGKPRYADVPLDCPLAFNGREFHKIVVRRLTVAEVGAYFDALVELRKTDENTVLPFPIFVDEQGNDLPDGLLDVLVDDDMTRLNEVAVDFLPRRFRAGTPEAEPNGIASPSAGAASAS